MRSLSSTLLAAQKASTLKPKVKIVLTGANSYTYEEDRILDIQHTEEGDKQTALVILDNSDGTLTSLDLKGYKGVIHYGLVASGSEYSYCAPLYVVAQQLISRQGVLACSLALAGISNLLDADRASGEYTPDDSDTDTVKTLFRKIAGDSGVTHLAVYNHCTAYNVTFDSEDSLIDSYQPKDSFAIYLNSNRLSKLEELLRYTKCVMRIEDDGEIHVFVPVISTSTAWQASHAYSLNDTIVPTTLNDYEYKCTTAGTSGASEPTWTTDIGDTISDGGVVWTVSYDYEYSLGATFHTFFNKSYRKRLVIPNYIVVSSLESQATPYTGYAEDTASSDLIEKRQYKQMRVTGNQQCTDIATALLSHLQLDAEKGHGLAPMNVGAEVYDFVKITDSRESDFRVGNIGYIKRHYKPGSYTIEIRFGALSLLGLMGTMSPSLTAGGTPDISQLVDLIMELMSYINDLAAILDSVVAYLTWFSRYIYITDAGDIIMNPKLNRMVHVAGDLSIGSGEFFGLMLAGAATTLRWYDKGGTLDHAFVPETPGHGKLGNVTYEWLEMHGKKAYHDTRLKIPVGTDLYD